MKIHIKTKRQYYPSLNLPVCFLVHKHLSGQHRKLIHLRVEFTYLYEVCFLNARPFNFSSSESSTSAKLLKESLPPIASSLLQPWSFVSPPVAPRAFIRPLKVGGFLSACERHGLDRGSMLRQAVDPLSAANRDKSGRLKKAGTGGRGKGSPCDRRPGHGASGGGCCSRRSATRSRTQLTG